MIQLQKKIKINKYLINFLEISAIITITYLVALPFYPELRYKIRDNKEIEILETKILETSSSKELEVVINNQIEALSQKEFAVSADRLIINKIGVNIPIVVSTNADYGLSKGAWLDPEGSRPDKGGNTILTGHRFKYLPPSNMTFYLLDKMEKNDLISVLWQEKYYFYKVKEKKIVNPEDLSILQQSDSPEITLYTCDPVYSQKNRLVVIAELLDFENEKK